MVVFARKLTLTPPGMTADDLDGLRATGLSEEQTLDVVLITSLFNFMNRLADGLGVELSSAAAAFGHQWLKQRPGDAWDFLRLPNS